jgi:hypothetical protein
MYKNKRLYLARINDTEAHNVKYFRGIETNYELISNKKETVILWDKT